MQLALNIPDNKAKEKKMLAIQIPNNLEQQLNLYCQQHQISINESIRLAIENLLTTANKPLSPYELGKEGFGADQTHEGDIAQNSKKMLKAVFKGIPC
jgi:hypothetical protein